MNKNILIALAAVLLLGAGYYFWRGDIRKGIIVGTEQNQNNGTPNPTPNPAAPAPTPPQSGSGSVPVSTKKIRIIVPNGGEIWQRNKQYQVRWDTNGLDPDLDIFVNLVTSTSIITNPFSSKVAGQEMFNLATYPSNEGSYAYTVPQSVKPGTYQVLIMAGKNCNSLESGERCEFDLSDRQFTIR